MDDKEKLLGLMKFWLFGTFLIIFVAATVYTGGAVGLGLVILRQAGYWIAIVITAILCVVWYYIYKWYLGRNG
jgi:hypothetical protein